MIDGLEQFWKVALSVAGLASIGSFVLWSLYKQWLNLPIFSTLTKQQQFNLLRLFLILTFLFAVLALAAYVLIKINVNYTVQESTDAVGIVPIEDRENLISSFRSLYDASDSDQKIEFALHAPRLGLDFKFQAPSEIYPYQLLNNLIDQFSLKSHVKIDRSVYPTGLQSGAWYQDWKLLRNGKVEGNEYFERDDKNYSQLGAVDGDVLALKVTWGLSALISSEGKKSSEEKVVEPPEVVF